MAHSRETLEHHIQAIEDRLEIYNLIASHPPSADTGASAYAEAVYTEDGVFDRGGDLSGATGNKAIATILKRRSPGRDRRRTRAFRKSAACRARRRPGGRHVLSANPHAEAIR